MVETVTKSGIVVREIVDDKTIHKVDTRPLEKALEVIDLSKYGTGVKEILFIVVALPPGDAIHKDEVIYDRRKQKLTLELNLNYLKVISITTDRILKMSAMLFLDSIGLYPQLRNFDIVGFKQEVKKIFLETGLFIAA